MWRNYLLVGVRTLMRNRVYSAINIFGLSVGLASCVLILLFVRHQFSYDRWLPEGERIYAVQSTLAGPDGETLRSARVPRVASSTLQRELPQIDQAASITLDRTTALRANRPFFIDLAFADPNLFEVLRLPFLHGDPRTALSQPGNVVLTESEARRLFGSANVVGQVLTTRFRGAPRDLVVTGVLRDLPDNTHLELAVVTPYANELFQISEGEASSWSEVDSHVYVKLRPGQSAAAIAARMPEIVRRNISDDSEAEPTGLHLVPVRDLYLDHSHEGSMKPGSDRYALAAFALIALLILTIACVNFANLATAQAIRRAREVALRKVLGARRGQLVVQFLGEAFLLTVAATLVALALVELTLPTFSQLVSAELNLRYFGVDGLIVPILLLALVVELICGLYPAFILSRQAPAGILRSYQGAALGGGPLRNLLVLSQFAISIGLIVSTVVIYAQTRHARTLSPGYEQSGLLVVDNFLRASSDSRLGFYEQVRRLPAVTAATRSDVAPADDQEVTGEFRRPGAPRPTFLNINSVDWGFAETLRLPLLAGRFFEEARPGDDSTTGWNPMGPEAEALLQRGANIVVSASAARALGYDTPGAAVGRQVMASLLERPEQVRATIVGVVGDARYRSVRDPVRPTVYYVNSTPYSYLMARYRNVTPAQLRDRVEGLWRHYYPNIPFEAAFAVDRVAALYAADARREQVFAAATGLAILVACLGLFGLAAFTAERRTKEIGIRKVFGARTSDIVRLLVWQFCQPVLLANLIAWPVAWWAMRGWLNQFSARVDLSPAWFVAAGAIALVVAALTVFAQVLRVARTNPIHALRYE